MKKVFLISILIFIAMIFLTLIGCGTAGSGTDFTLMDINGNELSLSDFNEKVVVLNFWATWCPPCREEIPDFVRVYDEYKYKDVQFIGVSNEDIYTLKDFSNDYDINYPILVDTKGVMENWQIRAIPTTFVLDRDGNVVFKNVGMMTAEQLENIIEDEL